MTVSAPPQQQLPTLAIVAALPRELAMLARDLGATRILDRDGILVQKAALAHTSILLVTAGMGQDRAALAVAAALGHAPVTCLLSIGLAGACDPALAPASVLEASLVIDSRSGERFSPVASLGLAISGTLVTTPEIASPSEKQRLHTSYGALAVDMEAATVARLAHAHSIPFAALKAISDDHTADLTHLARFASHRGHFRTRAFALHTAMRPRLWRPTLALGGASNAALQALTAALHQLVSKRLIDARS